MPSPQPSRTVSNHYDITGTVNVTNSEEVCAEVWKIIDATYPDNTRIKHSVGKAYQDFYSLYSGNYEGYHACDTLYHDLQHTLDMSLAMARLLHGYNREFPDSPIEGEKFLLGMVAALFHDAGYIRKKGIDTAPNGAYYTLCHVSRSGEFLANYLHHLGLEHHIPLAIQLVQFTGYETPIEHIPVTQVQDRHLGYLLGSADLLAQLSDRCYLEKCRDRLFPEFVLGGVTSESTQGDFLSPEQLLQQTPVFFENSVQTRLNQSFEGLHAVEAHYFGGKHFYMDTIKNNIAYIEKLIADGNLGALNRQPPQTPGQDLFPYSRVLTAQPAEQK